MIINHPRRLRELVGGYPSSVLSGCHSPGCVWCCTCRQTAALESSAFTVIPENGGKENCHPRSEFGAQNGSRISLGSYRNPIAELENEPEPFESLSLVVTTNPFIFLIKKKSQIC